MIQRQHRPLATWNGTRWVSSGIIVGKDRDWGGGPVGTTRRGYAQMEPQWLLSEPKPEHGAGK